MKYLLFRRNNPNVLAVFNQDKEVERSYIGYTIYSILDNPTDVARSELFFVPSLDSTVPKSCHKSKLINFNQFFANPVIGRNDKTKTFGKRLSREEKQGIVNMKSKGVKDKVIMDKFKVSRTTINNLYRNLGA